MHTHIRLLPLAAALAVGLVVPPLAAAQPNGAPGGQVPPGAPPGAMAPGMMAGPVFEQVNLTEKTAKGAVDSYLEIKKEYGDEALPKTKPGAAAKGGEVMAGVTDIIEEHGFQSVGDWNKTVISVALAYGVLKEGKLDEMDASIAKLDANPQIPEQMKGQLKKMLESTRPSDNNVKVVTALMEDDDYGPKLAQIQSSKKK